MMTKGVERLLLKYKGDILSAMPALIIAMVSAMLKSRSALHKWESARGFEYEWIGRSIAGGHGFSFPGGSRWLFTSTDAGQYFTTAWSEPLYPLYIGLQFFLLGEYGKLGLLFSNIAFHVATLLTLFIFIRKLKGIVAGYLSVVVFLLLPPWVVTGYLGNSVLSGFIILLAVPIVCWFVDDAGWKKAIPTGLFFGVLALTHAGTLLFTPALALFTAVWNRFSRKALLSVFVVALLSFATVLPWTIRNYAHFSEFVPVRNGVGQILHVSNRAMGATVNPDEKAPLAVTVPWTSSSLWDAYDKIMESGDKRRSLERYSEALIAAEIGAPYYAANEAQRDRYLSAAGKRYVLSHPLDTVILSVIKGLHFFFLNWPQLRFGIPVGTVVTAFAILGALLCINRKEVAVSTLFLVCYAAPYALTAPYFYRYRYPVEPLLIMLFCYAVLAIYDRAKLMLSEG